MESGVTTFRDVVRCELCETVVEIPDWPNHRDDHLRDNSEGSIRFCQNGQSGTIILCRKRKGHYGSHAGPLGELRWTGREIE